MTRPLRRFEYRSGDSPRERGRAHGEALREPVRALAALRLELVARLPGFGAAGPVLELAERHLPLLDALAPGPAQELRGIAEGAGLSAAELVVLNHYTDLKDLAPGAAPAESDGCSALYARTPRGTLLGQTWDMHGTAEPFILMLRAPEADGVPGAWLLTLTGCLALAGLSEAGVAVAINNLRCRDGRLGLVWPAIVRLALAAPGATAARDAVLAAPIGSGHHYLVADAERAWGIEATGTRKRVVFDGAAPVFLHTNHALDPEVAAVGDPLPASTTHERYACLAGGLETAGPPRDAADLWQRLGSHEGHPRSVCTHMAGPGDPHAMATCAAVVMEVEPRRLLAAAGCIHGREPERFSLA